MYKSNYRFVRKRDIFWTDSVEDSKGKEVVSIKQDEKITGWKDRTQKRITRSENKSTASNGGTEFYSTSSHSLRAELKFKFPCFREERKLFCRRDDATFVAGVAVVIVWQEAPQERDRGWRKRVSHDRESRRTRYHLETKFLKSLRNPREDLRFHRGRDLIKNRISP